MEPSIEAQLAVISTKLDTLLVQRDDHEKRIRSLEQWKWLATGIAAAAGSGIGAAASSLIAK
jgi:hypothetical protein